MDSKEVLICHVIFVKIPKNDNLYDCNNWRGLCVHPAVATVISTLSLHGVLPLLYSTIDAEQAGFRPG